MAIRLPLTFVSFYRFDSCSKTGMVMTDKTRIVVYAFARRSIAARGDARSEAAARFLTADCRSKMRDLRLHRGMSRSQY
jgi:hypothetical protein